jgi:uncharacterized coiled-coil DUF342 family protein
MQPATFNPPKIGQLTEVLMDIMKVKSDVREH